MKSLCRLIILLCLPIVFSCQTPKPAVKTITDDAWAHFNSGEVWAKQEQFDKAIFHYTRAIEINPKIWGAYYGRGSVHFQEKQYDEAISDFNKAIELDPDVETLAKGHGDDIEPPSWGNLDFPYDEEQSAWVDDLLSRINEGGKPVKPPAGKRCYVDRGGDLRIAAVAESGEEKETPRAFSTLTDLEGTAYVVSKEAMLDREDIEFLCVEPSPGNTRDLTIGLFFRQESWDKVYHATRKSLRRRVAVVKDHRVLSAPVILGTLIDVAQAGSVLTESDVGWLIQGLEPIDPSDEKLRGEAVLRWLERRVESHPDDSPAVSDFASRLSAKSDVASLVQLEQLVESHPGDMELTERLGYRYSREKEKVCDRASPVYERILLHETGRIRWSYFPFLHACFMEAKDYDRTITFYQGILEKEKSPWETALMIHGGLFHAYYQKGDVKKAFGELARCWAILRAVSFPSPKGKTLSDALSKVKKGEARMLQFIAVEMARIKSQGLK
jgi:hypothetical protein